MDGWDTALLIGASYLAVMILVRLMLAQRNQLLADFGKQIEAARAARKQRKKKKLKPDVLARTRRDRLRCRVSCTLNSTTMDRKLYIETVGCQMNLLDSELVVASLRSQGYAWLTRRSKPTRFCSTPAACGSTPRTRSTAPWAG